MVDYIEHTPDVNQKRKDVKDNFQSDRSFLTNVINNPTSPREERIAKIMRRLLRQVNDLIGGEE